MRAAPSSLASASRSRWPLVAGIAILVAFGCSRGTVFRSTQLESAFDFEGIERVAVHSICYRGYRLCEVFAKFANAEDSTFDHLAHLLALSPSDDPTLVVRGATDLPDSLNWYSVNFADQAQQGRLHVRVIANVEDDGYLGYIASYLDEEFIYVYARGWIDSIIRSVLQPKKPLWGHVSIIEK